MRRKHVRERKHSPTVMRSLKKGIVIEFPVVGRNKDLSILNDNGWVARAIARFKQPHSGCSSDKSTRGWEEDLNMNCMAYPRRIRKSTNKNATRRSHGIMWCLP